MSEIAKMEARIWLILNLFVTCW